MKQQGALEKSSLTQTRQALANRRGRSSTTLLRPSPTTAAPIEATPPQEAPVQCEAPHHHHGAGLDPTVNDYGPTIAFRNDRVIVVFFGIFVGVGALLAMLHSSFYFAAHAVAEPRVFVTLLLAVAIGAPFTSFMITRLLDIRSWLGGDKTFLQWIRTITFSLWGGLQGGFDISIVVASLFGIAPLALLDAVVIGLPLAQALGRVGCLNYGCCWGRPCSEFSILAVRYRNPTTKIMRYKPELAGVALHPVQVYSTLANVGIYSVLMTLWVTQPDRREGLLAATFMMLYGTKRFCVEFLRSDFPRAHRLRLTMWQFLSSFVAVAGAVLLVAVVPGNDVVTPADAGAGLTSALVWSPLAVVGALIMGAVYSVHGRKVGSW